MAFYLRESDELRRRGRVRADHARYLATLLDRRRLLVRAWALARAAALRSGVPPWTLIGDALTSAWQERRRHLAAIG